MLYLQNLWNLFIEMSFYIVIGLFFTGLLHSFIKKDLILKQVGKNNTSSVVKASVIGVPLPLCSCGVVPTSLYLGKSGASKGAVVSFLTSTPQTGVDSIIATYGMLGPLFAIYRAITAFISGIISGILTNIFCKKEKIKDKEEKNCCSTTPKEPICCSKTKGTIEKKEEQTCCSKKVEESICCCSKTKKPTTFLTKIKESLKYGFGDFLDEIVVHFIIGLLIAALISTLIPPNILTNFSNPIITMAIMVIIGIPMYICSTASIPIAVSLIMKGISPGAAFVFLFAGPVTNIASIVIIIKSLGKKVTSLYLISASICAISFGLLLDYIIKVFGYDMAVQIGSHTSGHHHNLFMTIVSVLFGILLIKSLFKKMKSKLIKSE